MITRFQSIRHDIFANFNWPSDLPEFQDYNLIYGWNGTGKTTLADLLRHIELGSRPRGGFIVETKSGIVDCSSPPSAPPLSIRVFTRDFVDQTIFTESGDVAPIYFVGRESVKRKQEADALSERKTGIEEELSEYRWRIGTAKKDLESHCTVIAGSVKTRLRSSGSGANKYNNYNKASYKDRCNSINVNDEKKYLLSADQMQRFDSEKGATPKESIAPISWAPISLKTLGSDVGVLLDRKVTSGVIDNLQKDEARNSWTRTGEALHRGRQSESCLFCGSPLPPNLMQELEGHFGDEYTALVSEVDSRIQSLKSTFDAARKSELPEKGEFYDNLQGDYSDLRDRLQEGISRYCGKIQDLVRALEKKRKNPFSSQQQLDCRDDDELPSLLEQINALITEQKQRTGDFRGIVVRAREALEFHLVSESLQKYLELSEAVQLAERTLLELTKSLASAESEITILERDLIQHRRPADELNRSLLEYLGHDEIRFETKAKGYRILRRGNLAKRLSEGEKTAIALLYFLKSLEDKDFILKDGIVVLDDPVSSLDQNSLYNAFSFIQERTRNAAQLFVMTHSFSFFRQVRNWFKDSHRRRKKGGRTAEFYSIRCSSEGNGRYSELVALDGMLRNYNSEYHYLFALIYRARNSKSNDSSDALHLPNVARRLLEIFLSFWRPATGGSFYSRLKNSDFSPAKITRIYQFVSTFSHGEDFSPDSERDMSILGESADILQDVLDFIGHESSQHYREMEKLVNRGS